MVSAFLGAAIPGTGLFGIYISRMIRYHMEISVQYAVMTALAMVLIFIPALAHINFVQYYYCKKYGITCDENGNETSPNLEEKAQKNQKQKNIKHIEKVMRKNLFS